MTEHLNSPLKFCSIYIYNVIDTFLFTEFSDMLSNFQKATICKLFNTTF